MERTKVFGYVRVSTMTQAVKGHGLDTQISEIKKYCKTHELELIEIFKDKGISGTTLDRPGLSEMLASFNGVRKVVVLNTSRLWRDDATVKAFVKRAFRQAQADIISIEQESYSIYNNDPGDFLTNGILELLDQYERMCINIKLAKGRKTKARKGCKACGVAPIGYCWSANAQIVKDEYYGSIVEDIFKKYLELGSIGKVQKYLNESAITTPRDKAFSKQAIANILTNEFYKGIITHGDVRTTGTHPPLVSAILFGRVQTRLGANRRNNVQ